MADCVAAIVVSCRSQEEVRCLLRERLVGIIKSDSGLISEAVKRCIAPALRGLRSEVAVLPFRPVLAVAIGLIDRRSVMAESCAAQEGAP